MSSLVPIKASKQKKLNISEKFKVTDNMRPDDFDCIASITCDTGKIIRNNIREHLLKANKEYKDKITELASGLTAQQDVDIKDSTKIEEFQNAVKLADDIRIQKMGNKIPILNELKCKLKVGAVETEGKIVEIDVVDKSVKISYRQQNAQGIEDKFESIKIEDLCIGGDAYHADGSMCSLDQAGGNNKKINLRNKKNNDTQSPQTGSADDYAICE